MGLPREIKTEKQAIKHSILMWHWLWKNPKKEKYDYFESCGHNRTFLLVWVSACACCEYYRNKDTGSCRVYIGDGCPLVSQEMCSIGFPWSSFSKWHNGIKKKHNAKKLLDALVERWKERGWKDPAVETIIKNGGR